MTPSFYSIPPLLASILVLIVGIFILTRNIHSSTNRTFFFIHLTAFIWLFGFFVLYSVTDEKLATLVYKFLYTGVIFIPITFYHFIRRFLNLKNKNISVISNYLIGIVFTLLVYFTDQFLIGLQTCYWGFQTKAGPAHNIFLLYFFSVFVYCFNLLWRELNNLNRDPKDIKQIRYVFWAFVVAIMASTDWLPVYGIEFYPIGFLFMTIFTVVTSIAILKHQLFDISIIVRGSFVYSMLLSMIILAYVFIISICERYFTSYLGYKSYFLIIVASFCITLSLVPVRNWLVYIVDKHFLKIDSDKLALENTRLREAVQTNDRLKAVATLAAGMAHEIKNPLTSIKTFAEYLPKKYDDPEFRSKFSKLVVDEVDRVNSIVQQLLDFSKPTDPVLRPLDISEALDETHSLLSSSLVRAKIEVTKNFDSSLSVMADKNQLKQALLNLILNAIQSMPTGGTLTISTRPVKSKFAAISVQDTGAGINAEHLPHIFDPFYTTKEGGTGLGLAIVHSIITKHGGKIDVKSTVGVGTIVTITLKRQLT